MAVKNDEVPDTTALADRVVEGRAGAAQLLMLPTAVQDVVSFRGSFETAPDLTAATEVGGRADDLVQHVLTDLLDKGTRERDRFAIAEALEGRGAQLSFYADGLRIGFAGRALREDLDTVLGILAEQLRTPLLDPDEFAKEQARAIAGVQRAMDSTGAQSAGALRRHLYPSAHPGFSRSPEDELEALEAMTVESVHAYHAQHVGSDQLKMAVVGDLDPSAVTGAVEATLGDWSPHGQTAQFAAEAEEAGPQRLELPMPDKQNLDVRLGHALSLRRDSDDFLALYVGVFALGGNFSARLMQTVRDEMGLTYGIGAHVRDVAVEHDGHVRLDVSLSGQNVEPGIEATKSVLCKLLDEGIRLDELDEKQTTIMGTHLVGLATTRGLAARLLVNAERGFPVSYLDDYPDLIHSLTTEDVDAALRRHIDPDRLSVAIAGTMPDVNA